MKISWVACSDTAKLQLRPSQGPDLVLNHASDLRKEVLTDDTVQVAVLWGGFVLDALSQTDPLFLCFTHKGPRASLTPWQKKGRKIKLVSWTAETGIKLKNPKRLKLVFDNIGMKTK